MNEFKLSDFVKPRPDLKPSDQSIDHAKIGLVFGMVNLHGKTHYEYTLCKCPTCYNILEHSRLMFQHLETLLGVSIDVYGLEADSLMRYEAEVQARGYPEPRKHDTMQPGESAHDATTRLGRVE